MSAPAPSSRKSAPAKSTAKKPRVKAKAKAAQGKKTGKVAPKTVTPAAPVEVVLAKPQVAAPETTAASIEAQPPAAEVTDEQVGQRAYQIWIEKGRPYGQEQANWEQAVAELRG